MTSLALTLAVACFVLAALYPMIRTHARLSTNDASQTVKPGSDVVASKPATAQFSAFIIALLLLSATPALAQEHGGILDGSVIERIREVRESLDAHREALRENVAEAREWRGLFSRFDGTFLNRISTLVWLTFWVLIVALGSWGLRELASVVKATGEAMKAFRREESE